MTIGTVVRVRALRVRVRDDRNTVTWEEMAPPPDRLAVVTGRSRRYSGRVTPGYGGSRLGMFEDAEGPSFEQSACHVVWLVRFTLTGAERVAFITDVEPVDPPKNWALPVGGFVGWHGR